VKVAGDYVCSLQVDDGASVAIADSLLLAVDGGNWFANATSDTVWFAAPGLYPFRAYFYDCPPCCRGFRFGGMGPAGSGLMTFTPGFDFNTDLGPCRTFGNNGPGASLVPGALFFSALPTSDVAPDAGEAGPRTLMNVAASPNPAHGTVRLSAELARPQRVWAEVYDTNGRRVAVPANGTPCLAGTVSWAWTPLQRAHAPGGSAYFYRLRTDDGSRAGGRITIVN
jgi:hypothetical protein